MPIPEGYTYPLLPTAAEAHAIALPGADMELEKYKGEVATAILCAAHGGLTALQLRIPFEMFTSIINWLDAAGYVVGSIERVETMQIVSVQWRNV